MNREILIMFVSLLPKVIVNHISISMVLNAFQDSGKCPVTGEALTMDDIVPVKTNKVSEENSNLSPFSLSIGIFILDKIEISIF